MQSDLIKNNSFGLPKNLPGSIQVPVNGASYNCAQNDGYWEILYKNNNSKGNFTINFKCTFIQQEERVLLPHWLVVKVRVRLFEF
jgi:hypothetical protein